jgi:glyceraldehyde 3-phosphate dehydrogenase
MANVAINGLGRIGRSVLKILEESPELELVAINDLTPLDNLVYLLRYDTVYGRYSKNVTTDENKLVIGDHQIHAFNEREPQRLPWRDLKVDIVFECTGAFTKRKDLAQHLEAGAKHAILSAPAKGNDMAFIVYGVNKLDKSHSNLFSMASCTTNCIAPVAEVMERRIGVKKAVMTTVHAYTSNQSIVDSPSNRKERGRAGAANLIPTSTGAATAMTEVLPGYAGKFDGIAIRAPVPVGSVSDINFVTKRNTTVDEINDIFREEARTERYSGVLGVAEDPIVSSDIIMDPRASIVDLTRTMVVNGDLVKVMSWYDNEWGYANQMVKQALTLV